MNVAKLNSNLWNTTSENVWRLCLVICIGLSAFTFYSGINVVSEYGAQLKEAGKAIHNDSALFVLPMSPIILLWYGLRSALFIGLAWHIFFNKDWLVGTKLKSPFYKTALAILLSVCLVQSLIIWQKNSDDGRLARSVIKDFKISARELCPQRSFLSSELMSQSVFTSAVSHAEKVGKDVDYWILVKSICSSNISTGN